MKPSQSRHLKAVIRSSIVASIISPQYPNHKGSMTLEINLFKRLRVGPTLSKKERLPLILTSLLLPSFFVLFLWICGMEGIVRRSCYQWKIAKARLGLAGPSSASQVAAAAAAATQYSFAYDRKGCKKKEATRAELPQKKLFHGKSRALARWNSFWEDWCPSWSMDWRNGYIYQRRYEIQYWSGGTTNGSCQQLNESCLCRIETNIGARHVPSTDRVFLFKPTTPVGMPRTGACNYANQQLWIWRKELDYLVCASIHVTIKRENTPTPVCCRWEMLPTGIRKDSKYDQEQDARTTDIAFRTKGPV